MKNPLLKTITEMPSNAAYWMGKRNDYKRMIAELLESTTVGDLSEEQYELKALYWWLDLANDTFTKEMGWV